MFLRQILNELIYCFSPFYAIALPTSSNKIANIVSPAQFKRDYVVNLKP